MPDPINRCQNALLSKREAIDAHHVGSWHLCRKNVFLILWKTFSNIQLRSDRILIGYVGSVSNWKNRIAHLTLLHSEKFLTHSINGSENNSFLMSHKINIFTELCFNINLHPPLACVINWTTNLLCEKRKNNNNNNNWSEKMCFSWIRNTANNPLLIPERHGVVVTYNSNVKMPSAWVDCRRMLYAHALEREILNQVVS